MQESMVFSYDGQSSKKFGVFLGHVESGLYHEPFLPERRIVEKKIANREKPYFQTIEQEPLQFPMTIVMTEWNNYDIKRQIARWLFQDYYKPLYFESNPERIYYAIIEGASEIHHNGVRDYNDTHAYITVNVRCDSPYAYTPEYPLPNITFSDDKRAVEFSDEKSALGEGKIDNLIYSNQSLRLKGGVNNWNEFQQRFEYWSEVK